MSLLSRASSIDAQMYTIERFIMLNCNTAHYGGMSMKFLLCTLLILGFEQAITAGPIALLSAAVQHPAVVVGTASYLGSRLANRGNGGSQSSEMPQVIESLYNRAQHCVAENGNLREVVGSLRRDAHDLHQARKELKDREGENRQLLTQQIGLQIDNRHQAAAIERLSTEKQELRQENSELRKDLHEFVHSSPSTTPGFLNTKNLFLLGGAACCTGVVAYAAGQKISRLERVVHRDPYINWQPQGTRDVRSVSSDKLVQSLARISLVRKASVTTPATPEIIVRLIQEIKKRIRIIQDYLSWKPWQSSVLASCLGLEEEKFDHAEEKLNRLFTIEAQLQRALETNTETN
jgi:hypothetical protein